MSDLRTKEKWKFKTHAIILEVDVYEGTKTYNLWFFIWLITLLPLIWVVFL